MVMLVETSLKKAMAKAPRCGGGGNVAVQPHLRQGGELELETNTQES